MRGPKNLHLRAAIEISFIVFLFYSNLLMGEFTVSAGHHKTLLAAVTNIITVKTLAIALVTSVLGHIGFQMLREKT